MVVSFSIASMGVCATRDTSSLVTMKGGQICMVLLGRHRMMTKDSLGMQTGELTCG